MKRIFAHEPRLKELDNPNIRTNALQRYPELRKVFANGKLMAALESVLGKDCLLIPDIGIHDSCLLGGWHRDTGNLEKAGHKLHYEPDFHVVNVAIYFQDNRDDFAGGLDIVPGSQKTRATWWDKQKASNRKVKFVLSHLDRRGLLPEFVLHEKRGAYKIPSKSGDSLFFHIQCEHRPTHPKIMPVPEEHRKLAMFMIFSRNNAHAKAYKNFQFSLSSTWNGYVYPEDYVRDMNRYGVRLLEL